MPRRANSVASVSRCSRGTPEPDPVMRTTPGRGVVVLGGASTVPCRVSPPLPVKLTSVAVSPTGAGTGPEPDAPVWPIGAAEPDSAAGPAGRAAGVVARAGDVPRMNADRSAIAVFMSRTIVHRESSANRILQSSLCSTRLLIMKDDAEPVILDDPGRLKALSHPLRRQILRRLGSHGPATSTTIGEHLGANTGTTSYHLRQ